jgi:hypothetical protein
MNCRKAARNDCDRAPIPMKIGIKFLQLLSQKNCGSSFINWIPAFAGMGFACKTLLPHVIPAKAGILAISSAQAANGIPAFAGMTKVRQHHTPASIGYFKSG